MKKIALIYMGGTFGCIGEPLTPMDAALFIPQLKKMLPLNLDIECFNAPSMKDSSAFIASDWLLLIQLIQRLQLQQYQHFVIVHGTDTLSYAAATLARFLQNACHVILTGSQYPLLNIQGTHHRDFSDAMDNLNTALTQISTISTGVYLAFHHQVLHACTALKVHSTALDAFRGIRFDQPLNLHDEAQFIVQDEHIQRIDELKLLNWMMQPIPAQQLLIHLENLKHQPPDVLILQGYGTGNIAVNADIIQQFLAIQQLGCRVILDTQVPFGGLDQRYAVSQWVHEAKILINDSHSHSDLYAKILKMYLQYPTSDQWHDHWYAQ